MKELETERLLLREWSQNDAEDLFEYAQTDLVGPNAGWPPHEDIEVSKSIIDMFIEENDVYAIELKSENKVIGGIGIHNTCPDESMKEHKQKEIGYVLNPKYWGQGIAPEAVEKVIEFCFQDLNLDILWCGHFDFNDKSKRVNEKCGFNYCFTKEIELKLLGDKKVSMMYYNMVNTRNKL